MGLEGGQEGAVDVERCDRAGVFWCLGALPVETCFPDEVGFAGAWFAEHPWQCRVVDDVVSASYAAGVEQGHGVGDRTGGECCGCFVWVTVVSGQCRGDVLTDQILAGA
ncbi:hypothetical protein TU94_00265 [Streptomyces cyaneogriseus subsp. noncyanogenus]|uniref:Uncharacterized protein n=1 Tax=Streptomyces cyaneogriseus subsp. noncyanogenus TaxID=477245 RepID=A0A0C5FRC6_9ACTN|nr:hypothetical protein TU94_00265 [Streptomyces cyaneogriseus subsp. noncyanogenus]